MLNHPQVWALFPRNVKFLWNVKPFDAAGTMYHLHAIKVTGADGRAPLTGDVVVSARAEFDAMRGSAAKINMSMNGEGARTWARITKDMWPICGVVLDN
jgi:SecD/SecF fusion protein